MPLSDGFLKISKCVSCSSNLNYEFEKFKCSKCGRYYPVVSDIPRFVASEDYSSSFGFQWNQHAQTQIDKFNGTTISRDRLFRESLWAPEELSNQSVIECGSGAGRFTQVLLESGARVFSIDFSRAVEANLKNNQGSKNLFLAQSSIYELPFQDNSFDYLLCLGVIQHTPDVKKSVEAMLKCLKPGGKFCIDVYASPLSYLHPRHLIRPLSKRLSKDRLYRIIERLAPPLMKLSTWLHAVPFIGQGLARLVPVANWRSNIKLPNEEMYMEWSILDTFDWYSPAYEKPQSYGTLNRWFRGFGLQSYQIVRERGLYIIRGIK